MGTHGASSPSSLSAHPSCHCVIHRAAACTSLSSLWHGPWKLGGRALRTAGTHRHMGYPHRQAQHQRYRLESVHALASVPIDGPRSANACSARAPGRGGRFRVGHEQHTVSHLFGTHLVLPRSVSPAAAQTERRATDSRRKHGTGSRHAHASMYDVVSHHSRTHAHAIIGGSQSGRDRRGLRAACIDSLGAREAKYAHSSRLEVNLVP